jgi:hypothetical protein
VGINLSVLSGPQGDVGNPSLKGNTIQMNLFEDTAYDVVIDGIEASASGGTAWNGHIAGLTPSYAYMIYTDGIFAAHVASLEGVYEVQYAGNDVYMISQLDQSLYPDDIVLEPALPEDALPSVEPDVNTLAITYRRHGPHTQGSHCRGRRFCHECQSRSGGSGDEPVLYQQQR